MIYNSIEALPEDIKEKLPPEAQRIYVRAHNAAWNSFKKEHTPPGEELESVRAYAADRKAWDAVRKRYSFNETNGRWEPIPQDATQETRR